jgi:hypothetical protein
MIRQLASQGRNSASRKYFSTSARRNGYEDTIQNLKIGKHTRVIFQGFTGEVLYSVSQKTIEMRADELYRETSESIANVLPILRTYER